MTEKTDLELLTDEREKSAILQAQFDAQSKDLLETREKLSNAETAIATHAADRSELEAKLTKATEAKAAVEKQAGELSAKLEKAAAHGVKAPESDATGRESENGLEACGTLSEQFIALSGKDPERAFAFYQQHKSELLAAAV